MINDLFGEYLKEKRKEAKLSLRDIAKLGYDKAAWSRHERNLSLPRIESLIKISSILKINIIELLLKCKYISKEDIDEYINNF